MCNMAAILKFKMVATRGRLRVGPNRKMIPQGSSISVPSFIISPQSEIFFDLTAGLCGRHFIDHRYTR